MTDTRQPNQLRQRANMVERQMESWQPRAHNSSATVVQSLITRIRRFFDLQSASIWADVAAEAPDVRGTMLDVGCGAQPLRPLFSSKVRYIGIDSVHAKSHFGYEIPDTIYYDGDTWPLEDRSVDFILCTETLEHVMDTRQFLAEASRCLAPGGRMLVTVPFAARWHYIPYDYWRFTPSSLKSSLVEAGFRDIAIYARGNEITVACYKVMALMLPFLMPQRKSPLSALALRVIGLLCSPALMILAVIGNLSLTGRGGDDCIGYTALAEKPRHV